MANKMKTGLASSVASHIWIVINEQKTTTQQTDLLRPSSQPTESSSNYINFFLKVAGGLSTSKHLIPSLTTSYDPDTNNDFTEHNSIFGLNDDATAEPKPILSTNINVTTAVVIKTTTRRPYDKLRKRGFNSMVDFGRSYGLRKLDIGDIYEVRDILNSLD